MEGGISVKGNMSEKVRHPSITVCTSQTRFSIKAVLEKENAASLSAIQKGSIIHSFIPLINHSSILSHFHSFTHHHLYPCIIQQAQCYSEGLRFQDVKSTKENNEQ